MDTDYKFIAIDVGSYGKNSDGGVLSNSKLGEKLRKNDFNLLQPAPLIENGDLHTYIIVRDEAFALKTCKLRPYSRK